MHRKGQKHFEGGRHSSQTSYPQHRRIRFQSVPAGDIGHFWFQFCNLFTICKYIRIVRSTTFIDWVKTGIYSMGSEGGSSGRKGGGSLSSADDQKPSSSWARLVSADSSHSDMEIQADEMTINSSIMGLSSSSTHNIFKIYRNVDSGIVKLQNLSSHAILINGQILEEKEHMSIESGNEIVLGSERSGFPIYHVHFIQGERHSECSEEVSSLVDNLKCSICLNIWHDVVTVTPCLHNFCNACFSHWYRRLKIKRSNCICPQCRSDVYSVGRNHSLQNIIEDMLKNNPSLKRSDEDIIQLNKDSIVQSNIVFAIQDFPYAGMDFRNDPDMVLPQGEQWDDRDVGPWRLANLRAFERRVPAVPAPSPQDAAVETLAELEQDLERLTADIPETTIHDIPI